MRRRTFCGLLGLSALAAATARAGDEPAAPRAADLSPTLARIVLRVPEGCEVTANEKAYGAKREIDYPGLTPGKTYAVQIRIAFPGGKAAQRLALIVGGQATEVAAQSPSRIVFSSAHEGDEWQLYATLEGGQTLVRLADFDGNMQHPRLAPDGGNVLFDSGGDLHLLRAAGGPALRLTEGVQGDWSPDGKRIAFLRGRGLFGGGAQAFVCNADGTNAVELADKRQKKECLRWSPDGRELLFLAVRPGEKEGFIAFQDIFVMQADGTGVRQLTNRLWGCRYPAWSPDGSRIAFVATGGSGGQGGPGIFVMTSRGGGARRLTSGEDHHPAWSPDGKQLAFQREAGPTGPAPTNLFTINADGTALTQLTKFTKSPGTPAGVDWR